MSGQQEDEPRSPKGALSRLKDDLINLQQLQGWFMRNLVTSGEHDMSMKEIWRNFCFDNQVYCSLALFGNLVYRHVFTQNTCWTGVTRVGETNNKKYNLSWAPHRPAISAERLDEFFANITEEKEKRDRRADCAEPSQRKVKNPVKIQPEMLVGWWESRLEVVETESCQMKMREIWLKFTKECNIHISLALFGELSVRYVLRTNPQFGGVVRTRGIHDKKYSLRWKPVLYSRSPPRAHPTNLHPQQMSYATDCNSPAPFAPQYRQFGPMDGITNAFGQTVTIA